MITGYNTDIEYEGVTYHVQTEDKGLAKPVILSLVYDRGTILASKRVPYDDLLDGGLDEKVLAARLSRQHTLICAAIRAGRIEDLKRMTMREGAPRQVSNKTAAPGGRSVRVAGNRVPAVTLDELEGLLLPIPKPVYGRVLDVPVARPSIEPAARPASISDGDVIIPAEAVAIVSEMVGSERPVNNKLSIELLGEVRLKGGERKSMTFMVCRGTDRRIVPSAQLMVKVLGTSFRPLIFHASTDDNGLAKVNVQLPHFNSGRAALLVRAVSDGEEVELRRSILHG